MSHVLTPYIRPWTFPVLLLVLALLPACGSASPPILEPTSTPVITVEAKTPLESIPSSSTGDNQFTIPDKPALKYPNLGSRLSQLVVQVEDGEISAEEAASDAPLHREDSVAVTIHISNNSNGVMDFLKSNSVSPRNTGEDYIEAYVPISLLGQTSQQPGVFRVREIIPPQTPGNG